LDEIGSWKESQLEVLNLASFKLDLAFLSFQPMAESRLGVFNYFSA
jgi:hypothetical protein